MDEIDRIINTIFIDSRNNRIKVKEYDSDLDNGTDTKCFNCQFFIDRNNKDCRINLCSEMMRKDNKNVIFKKI